MNVSSTVDEGNNSNRFKHFMRIELEQYVNLFCWLVAVQKVSE